ncbi:MAG: hypothetical protein WC306_02395 [Candidatus Paceibacterota bacterium]|jgi:hypothetical protein
MQFRVLEAKSLEELALGIMTSDSCPGDDCNDDTGGCLPADSSCGQDC